MSKAKKLEVEVEIGDRIVTIKCNQMCVEEMKVNGKIQKVIRFVGSDVDIFATMLNALISVRVEGRPNATIE